MQQVLSTQCDRRKLFISLSARLDSRRLAVTVAGRALDTLTRYYYQPSYRIKSKNSNDTERRAVSLWQPSFLSTPRSAKEHLLVATTWRRVWHTIFTTFYHIRRLKQVRRLLGPEVTVKLVTFISADLTVATLCSPDYLSRPYHLLMAFRTQQHVSSLSSVYVITW